MLDIGNHHRTPAAKITDKVLREVYPYARFGTPKWKSRFRSENNENKLCRAFVDTGPCVARPTCIRAGSERAGRIKGLPDCQTQRHCGSAADLDGFDPRAHRSGREL